MNIEVDQSELQQPDFFFPPLLVKCNERKRQKWHTEENDR